MTTRNVMFFDDGQTHKSLRIDRHSWRRAVEFHVVFGDSAAIFHGFDSFADVVRIDCAV